MSAEVEMVFGQSPDSMHYNDRGEGLPFLQGNADFTDHHPETGVFTKEAGKACKIGDTLISVRAPVGELSRADKVYALGRGIAALRPRTMDSTFFFYAMYRWRGPLLRAGQGSTFEAVTARHFAQLLCLVPPPDEQTRIMETLSATDEYIRALEEQIRKAKVVKKSLLQRFPCVVRHGTGTPLFRVSDISSGFTKGRDLSGHDTLTVAYLTVVNVLEGALDLTAVSTAEIKCSELESLRLRDGDVLMTEGGDRDKLGRGCIWQGQIDPIVCQNHIFRVRMTGAELRPWFFHYLLQVPSSKRYFFSVAKQTNNLCTINSRDLRRFELPRLDPSEQDLWAERMTASDQLIASLKNELTAARRVKQSLLQNLLTGRIRLQP